ncbi:MAG: hypothetical protein ACW98X_25460 [Promethearchaeota archaeon]|jgi:hypothetical protein
MSNSPAIIIPLSRKAFSVLRAIAGFAEVKYMYLIRMYNEMGIVSIAINSKNVALPGSNKSNFKIRYNEYVMNRDPAINTWN